MVSSISPSPLPCQSKKRIFFKPCYCKLTANLNNKQLNLLSMQRISKPKTEINLTSSKQFSLSYAEFSCKLTNNSYLLKFKCTQSKRCGLTKRSLTKAVKMLLTHFSFWSGLKNSTPSVWLTILCRQLRYMSVYKR